MSLHIHNHSHSESHTHDHQHSVDHFLQDEIPAEKCTQNSVAEELLSHIPLLLSFPTCLLAANLISNSPIVKYGYAPVLLCSLISVLNKLILRPRGTSNVYQFPLLILSILYLNLIVDAIQTSVYISALLLTDDILPIIAVTGTSMVLQVDLGDWKFTLARLVAFVPPFVLRGSLRTLLHVGNLIIPLLCMLLSAIGIALSREIVNFSMLFVFIGCSAIMLVTLNDNPDFFAGSRRAIPSICGLISVLLQYLSFEKMDFWSFIVVVAGVLVTNNAEHQVSRSKSDEKGLFRSMLFDKNTGAIFSFLLLNTSFMFIQLLYSFRSKSLGLLSDSLHMALDCTSLALGLVAGVIAKRPASTRFPFGFNKIETLAGFTNGVLLIGIVVGILVEAVERLFHPVQLKNSGELLVVSFLGLVVNLVGLFAFNHDGHDHGDNDNMKGIFLHILADTLGSVGVVISTLLTKWTGYSIFDPLASLFIAIMILISSIPLIKSSARQLLLALDDKKYNIVKDALNQITKIPGISGYSTPRFWPDKEAVHSHSHGPSLGGHDDHGHGHSHGHSHGHDHDSHCDDHHEKSEPEREYKMIGYIHVQYVEGENSTIIKKRVESLFEKMKIKAYVQVEPRDSPCWCRSPASRTSTPVS